MHRVKKLVFVTLIFSLLLTSFSTNIYAKQSDVIPNSKAGILDKGLYKAILKTLKKKSKSGTFTKAEAARITSLDANNFKKRRANIKSLKGIENLTGLKNLNLSYNNLTSLKGIGKLTKLEDLSVDNNKLVNLKGIEKLTGLKYLDASENKLVRLSEVKGLTNLVALHAWRNRIKSLSGIESLINLESLSLYDNKLVNLSGVEGLLNLRDLTVNNNKLNHLNGVENLTKLMSLAAGLNNLTRLPDLTKLTILDYQNTHFGFNKLSFEQLQKNAPSHLLENSFWLKKQMKYQNVKMTIQFITPKSAKKITRKTTKIVGQTHKGATILLKLGNKKMKKVKANKKGVFTFKKLNFKKLGGKKITLQSYLLEDGDVGDGVYKYILKTIQFTIRKIIN